MTKKETNSENQSGEINSVLSGVIHRNIKTMLQLRQNDEKAKGIGYSVAAYVIKHAGSPSFFIGQAFLILIWILANFGFISQIKIFDAHPFPILQLVIAIEAIFLAIIILLNQNRMLDSEKKREELDIQISLLTEHEVTKIIRVLDTVVKHMNIKNKEHDLNEFKTETSPEAVLDVIQKEMEKIENK